jgi:hypothetical protein
VLSFGSISLDEHLPWWWGLVLIIAVLTLPFSLLRLMVNDREPAGPRI